MNVLGICASPRKKSSTADLLASLLQGAEDGGCSIVQISLRDYDIRYCNGCEYCYRTGSCVQQDQFSDVYELILEADAVVLASPNYIDNVTAQMKTLLDRMGDTIHCQRLAGKYAVAVSTAGGSMAQDIADYLNSILQKMGADIVGSAAFNFADGEESVHRMYQHAYEVGVDLADAIITKGKYPDQEPIHAEMKERMRQLIMFRKDDWPYEYEYWLTKGWI